MPANSSKRKNKPSAAKRRMAEKIGPNTALVDRERLRTCHNTLVMAADALCDPAFQQPVELAALLRTQAVDMKRAANA